MKKIIVIFLLFSGIANAARTIFGGLSSTQTWTGTNTFTQPIKGNIIISTANYSFNSDKLDNKDSTDFQPVIKDKNGIKQSDEYIIRGSTVLPAGSSNVNGTTPSETTFILPVNEIVNVNITPYGQSSSSNEDEIFVEDIYISSFTVGNGETTDIKLKWLAVVK